MKRKVQPKKSKRNHKPKRLLTGKRKKALLLAALLIPGIPPF